MSKKLKILKHFGCFVLPEDFAGTISDGLRLLADYHEEKVLERKVSITPAKIGTPSDAEIDFINVRFDHAWDAWHKDGSRHTADVGVYELVEDGKSWKNLDPQ